MGECKGCERWIVERQDRYGDGTVITRSKIEPDGHGECQILGVETADSFGCNAFAEGEDHVLITLKAGAPWQHFRMGPCPDCRAAGNNGAACRRCAGTGNVRYYDDGHVGEEQTRLHPKEKENAAPLTCAKCNGVVQIAWVACPMCGTRLMAPAETEVIDDHLAGLP